LERKKWLNEMVLFRFLPIPKHVGGALKNVAMAKCSLKAACRRAFAPLSYDVYIGQAINMNSCQCIEKVYQLLFRQSLSSTLQHHDHPRLTGLLPQACRLLLLLQRRHRNLFVRLPENAITNCTAWPQYILINEPQTHCRE
jgi:hypothetical protein